MKHNSKGEDPELEEEEEEEAAIDAFQPNLKLYSPFLRLAVMLGLGLSYGKVLVLLGVTAAVVGPREILIISRTLGRITGRAVAYVQLARGQFQSVMQQSQTQQVHKELQDTLAQLEAIRHEVRSISMLNPGPMTRNLVNNIDQIPNINGSDEDIKTQRPPDNIDQNFPSNVGSESQKRHGDIGATGTISKDCSSSSLHLSTMHSRATAYAKLAESTALKTGSVMNNVNKDILNERSGLKVLPVSAESAGLLPSRPDKVKGSDIVLEAILEAEVASNAKDFFAQPENQIKQQ